MGHHSVEVPNMLSTLQPNTDKVLLVDDDATIRTLTLAQLERKGFKVVEAASVTDALRLISSDTFDVLLTDLNMPNAGDGFTLVSAMRHTQPSALILLVSGYPDVERAMATIAMEADQILTKPFDVAMLPALISEKLLGRQRVVHVEKQRVSVVLNRTKPDILRDWLERAKLSPDLNHLNIPDDERTGHIAKLVEDLVTRLTRSTGNFQPQDALFSNAAVEHGKLRARQGYTSAMLVHESRILQVTLFDTLQKNLSHLDFSLLLPDIMKIADEVDSQLTQTMLSFTEAKSHKAA